MKQRLSDAFPLLLAFILPIVGAIFAAQHFSEGRRDEGIRIGIATLLGVVAYAFLLTA